MANILSIFNGALVELSQRELTSRDDPVETRRVLERIWDAGIVRECLEQGVWNFAIRAVKSTDDPPAPSFGYQYRHAKPNDWVRTYKISAYESFNPVLNQYTDEGGYWYLDFDEVYVQYVSSHPSYGGNIALWPESFTRYVELYLALRAAPRILGSQAAAALSRGSQGLELRVNEALKNAKSKDAQNQPPEFPPVGTWVRSRTQDRFNRTDKDG